VITEVKTTASGLQTGDRITAYRKLTDSSWTTVPVGSGYRWVVQSVIGDALCGMDGNVLFSHAYEYAFCVERNTKDRYEAKTYEEFEAVAAGIQLGDSIVGWKIDHAAGWVTEWMGKAVDFVLDSTRADGVMMSGGTTIVNPRRSDVKYRVRRPLTQNTRAPVASKWNGKCPRCNKGTYTGFVTIEHEGGVCSAR
jgi:predicted butyrate kinase (DUF1464 family)